jgi:hypothetical protein
LKGGIAGYIALGRFVGAAAKQNGGGDEQAN